MSRSTLRVSQPARVGGWSLDVDNRAEPTKYLVRRYTEGQSRHVELFSDVAELAYQPASAVDVTADALVARTGMPRETAVALLIEMASKVVSANLGLPSSGSIPARS